MVHRAAARGEIIPPEVLADYPDLAAKYKPVVPEKGTTVPEKGMPPLEITKPGVKGETPKEAIKEIIEGKRESKIGTEEFKAKMLKELDKIEAPSGISAENKTIQIPGDGEFNIKIGTNILFLKKTIRNLYAEPKTKYKSKTIGRGVPFKFYPRERNTEIPIPIEYETKSGKKIKVLPEGHAFRDDVVAPKEKSLKEGLLDGTVEFIPKFKEPPATLSFMGVNPEVAKQLGENVLSGIKKAKEVTAPYTDWIKQAENRVSHPEGKALFKDIEHADELWHRYDGQINYKLKYENKLDKLSDEEGTKIADNIEAGNPQPYSKILDELHHEAKAKGLKLNYRKNYFPRVWKEDILNLVYNDINKLIGQLKEGTFSDKAIGKSLESVNAYTRNIIKHLIETRQAKSYTDALRKLEREALNELFPESQFEKPRVLDLPSWVYERNAKIVLPRYVDTITKRIAQVEVWGKKGEKAIERLSKISESDPTQAKLAGTILDMWSGQYERVKGLRGTAKKVADAYFGFETATKIGAGTAVIPNIFQTNISTMPDLGIWHTIRGSISLLSKGGRDMPRQSGVLRESMINAFTGKEPGGWIGKLSRKALKYPGFIAINKANLYLAANTFEHALNTWHNAAQKNTVYGRWAKKRLSDFGLKPEDAITENILLEKAYRFAVDSQLQRNVLKDPIVANTPVGRMFCLFKRFGYRQFVRSKDMIWREIKRGNVMPIVRLAIGGILGGEAVIWGKNQVKTLLSGEPYYRRDDDRVLKRIVNDLAAAGSLGVISDLMGIDDVTRIGGSLKFTVAPVFYSDAEKAYRAFNKVISEYDKYGDAWLVTKRNAPDLIDFLGSLPRYAAQRLETESEKENRLKYYKGRERTEILDLMLNGKGERASHKLELWNKHHPKESIKYQDISPEELRKRAEQKARTLAEAKGEYKPKEKETTDSQQPKAPSAPKEPSAPKAPKAPGR